MTGFLASVASLDEMEAARLGGADIVDLKEPARGALGAWSHDDLRRAVAAWTAWRGPRPLLSATIGDQPMTPGIVREAAEAVASTGVPIVKLGVFADGDPLACFAALEPLAARRRLIAVFFGDLAPDLALLEHVAAAGFHGAMLDTADKAAGGLRRHLGQPELSAFVNRARTLGLLTGLAGSLTIEDIAPLASLGPDYLGFRGALCVGGRTGRVDPAAIRNVRATLEESRRAA
ncbi:(5-formylfuran-3-yl)methyl phosphate synthase [Hansschlegelia plantiphila]|uniref:(5-formylfuran-3-yl)methyl phosphate synthase n=1 Tax=Hansschlegelia plantiphila TaxID=374655 RepID=A0A9W6J1V7_9HYPH|nr:(5-formylfuran-3-yl)methyl phosphate synthase [Hansschlegelia plantiphila]GLK69152.1 hypothetical protein GCM10008179_27900 [Hansschlegelia plantiphila]